MGTVYLRSASAPAGTYSTLNRVLTHAELDNNMSLFLRNDESDTMLGNLYINNGSPTIFLQDTDHRSGMIHQNSNVMYFLRGDGTNGTSWAQYDSYWPLTINLENNTAEFGGKINKRGINVPALHIQDAAPTPYNDGDMWWESDTGKLKIRYNDGSSTQWVDAFPIPDMTTYYSKAGGAISGAVTINSSLTTTGRIFADNGVTLSQGGTLASGLVITNSDIRSNATSAWTGDPGAQGKIQYHSNRWYIVADSSSDRIVQFRRNATDLSYVDNSGNYVGNVTGNLSGTATTATNWGTYGAVPGAGTSFGNANTIGRSDGNGYTYFNYINSNTGNSENPTVGQVIVTNTSDNFYRKASIAHVTSAVQSNASGTWSISISGNAATATSASSATTADQIDGIAFRNGNSSNGTGPDNFTTNGIGYVNSVPVTLYGQTDGSLYTQAYDSSWVHQIYGDYRTGQIAVRGRNSGAWQNWVPIPSFGKVLVFS